MLEILFKKVSNLATTLLKRETCTGVVFLWNFAKFLRIYLLYRSSPNDWFFGRVLLFFQLLMILPAIFFMPWRILWHFHPLTELWRLGSKVEKNKRSDPFQAFDILMLKDNYQLIKLLFLFWIQFSYFKSNLGVAINAKKKARDLPILAVGVKPLLWLSHILLNIWMRRG